ncbi:hypothetical protein [Paraburkholderia sp. DGU8]|uniref:hypothetical protein n=1 Tax=Paraburkholderia sp. DGU8 TaxID=3161997 RepID=UPI003465B8B7
MESVPELAEPARRARTTDRRVIIVDQLLVRHYSYDDDVPNFRGSAFAAWAFGALVAVLVHETAPWFSDAVAGMLVGGVAYYALSQGARHAVRQRNGLL